MRSQRQLSFLPSFKSLNTALKHGGDVRKGRRKVARPVDPKRPIHLVLTSSRAHSRGASPRKETLCRKGLQSGYAGKSPAFTHKGTVAPGLSEFP